MSRRQSLLQLLRDSFPTFGRALGAPGRVPRALRMVVATAIIGVLVPYATIVGRQIITPMDNLFDTIEVRAYHTCYFWRQWRAPVQPRSDIVIVGIDDESYDQIGIYPWPRTIHAELVRQLDAAGAKVIAFDVVFSDASPVEPVGLALNALEELKGVATGGRRDDLVPAIERHLAEFDALAWGESVAEADRLFAEACREAGNVILGAHVPEASLRAKTEEGTEELEVEVSGVMLPIPVLEDACRMPALVELPPDVLQSAQSVYVRLDREELVSPTERAMVIYPSLAAAVAGTYLGLAPDEIRKQLNQNRLGEQELITRQVYLDYDVVDGRIGSIKASGREMLINFVGPPEQTFTYIPYYQVLEGSERALQTCHGKIVMVGAVTRLLHDDWPTPFSPWYEPSRMPGVEVQANAVQTLLDGLFVRWAPAVWVEGVMFGVCFVMAFLTLWLRPVRTLPFVVLMWVGMFYLELHLFAQQRLWLPVVTSMLAGTTSYLGVTTVVYFTEEREKRHLRSMFQRYVGSSVMNEIMERHAVEMSGELRPVSMIFSDLQGFTTVSQDLGPQEVVALLRPYLTRMTEIIFAHQGTLDKFMGDGIMAYFGAPVAFDDHAEKAVLAAIEMQAELARMRERDELAVPLYMRIGVHTGEAVVGDVGSESLSNYTVIGDPVNVSSRLEELNKKHGSEILISDETYRRVQGLVVAEYLGEEVVRGRDEPTGVYRVTGLK